LAAATDDQQLRRTGRRPGVHGYGEIGVGFSTFVVRFDRLRGLDVAVVEGLTAVVAAAVGWRQSVGAEMKN
jgi:hypothetical protein